mgnify:CR=1 FL=1|jgi:hypothetical protein
MENYISYGSGYSKDNISKRDIKKAIKYLQNSDLEHGAFWLSIITDTEIVLEVNKELDLTLILDPETGKQIKSKAQNLEEVKHLFELHLKNKTIEVQKLLSKN